MAMLVYQRVYIYFLLYLFNICSTYLHIETAGSVHGPRLAACSPRPGWFASSGPPGAQRWGKTGHQRWRKRWPRCLMGAIWAMGTSYRSVDATSNPWICFQRFQRLPRNISELSPNSEALRLQLHDSACRKELYSSYPHSHFYQCKNNFKLQLSPAADMFLRKPPNIPIKSHHDLPAFHLAAGHRSETPWPLATCWPRSSCIICQMIHWLQCQSGEITYN